MFDAVFAFFGWDLAGDRDDFHVLANFATKLGGDVFGGVDESAKDNRVETVFDEVFG